MPITTQSYKGLVWSNASASEEVLIRAALVHPRFPTILSMVLEVGFERIHHEWKMLLEENTRETRLATAATTRILRNIQTGLSHAQTRNRKALELPQNV